MGENVYNKMFLFKMNTFHIRFKSFCKKCTRLRQNKTLLKQSFRFKINALLTLYLTKLSDIVPP